MQGAFIATMGIVISKILGIIYVIPFYSIVGEQGGALYGYAYNIYSIFLSLSTAGIPLAISKIISEYNTLHYYEAKERTFRIAKKYLSLVGVICFLILFIFAPQIAYLIIGDISGGNSYQDIIFVIRIISFSILIVPILSVYRGYLQGHRYMEPTSISQVLEQLIRVCIIIVGSFVSVKVLGLPLKYAVGFALFGATFGSLCSYVYLRFKVKNNKKDLKVGEHDEEEITLTNKDIICKILFYAFPFVFGDVLKSLYNSVDTFLLIRTLVNGLGFDVSVAESVMSVISTWGNKLNMIVIAIGTGFMVSLIPNLTVSLVKEDWNDIREKICATLNILLFVTIPMVVGLSFLANPVWNVFYGISEYGPKMFMVSVFISLSTVLLSLTTTTLLTLKKFKFLFINLSIGLIINAICDVPLVYLCDKVGLFPGYGAVFSTILGNLVSVIIVLGYLKKTIKLEFKSSINVLFRTIIGIILMVVVLSLLKFVVPITDIGRIASFFVIVLYAIVGILVYAIYSLKTRLVYDVFSYDVTEKYLKKLRRRK